MLFDKSTKIRVVRPDQQGLHNSLKSSVETSGKRKLMLKILKIPLAFSTFDQLYLRFFMLRNNDRLRFRTQMGNDKQLQNTSCAFSISQMSNKFFKNEILLRKKCSHKQQQLFHKAKTFLENFKNNINLTTKTSFVPVNAINYTFSPKIRSIRFMRQDYLKRK